VTYVTSCGRLVDASQDDNENRGAETNQRQARTRGLARDNRRLHNPRTSAESDRAERFEEEKLGVRKGSIGRVDRFPHQYHSNILRATENSAVHITSHRTSEELFMWRSQRLTQSPSDTRRDTISKSSV
jgi:hypothetical protein